MNTKEDAEYFMVKWVLDQLSQFDEEGKLVIYKEAIYKFNEKNISGELLDRYINRYITEYKLQKDL